MTKRSKARAPREQGSPNRSCTERVTIRTAILWSKGLRSRSVRSQSGRSRAVLPDERRGLDSVDRRPGRRGIGRAAGQRGGVGAAGGRDGAGPVARQRRLRRPAVVDPASSGRPRAGAVGHRGTATGRRAGGAGCGWTWPGSRISAHCDDPAAVVVADQVGPHLRLCAGHWADARTRLVGARVVRVLPTAEGGA
jgi:hypothetical protein